MWYALALSRDPARRLLVGIIGVLWVTLYGSFAAVTASGGLGTSVLWTALAIALAVGIVRAEGSLEALRRPLIVASCILAAGTLARVAAPRDASRAPEREPAEAQNLRAQEGTPRPDIYLVVMDKYTSGYWLQRSYALDHGPFEDSLHALGFVVPARARTNYAHTLLALTSLLEGRLLPRDSLGSGRGAYDALIERIAAAPIWSEAQERGYRIAFFPTTFSGTRRLPAADIVLTAALPPRVGLAETFRMHTPFGALLPARCDAGSCTAASAVPYPIETLPELEWKLQALASLPDSAGPIFGFLHLLAPHEPYLFDGQCAAREPWWPLSDQAPTNRDSLRIAYGTQVRCLDRLLLPALRELLRPRPGKVPPVVLLTGDHGNGLLAVDVLRGVTQEYESLSGEQLAERMSVFTAAHMPGAAAVMDDTMSLARLLPTMQHVVWGLPLREQADTSYWSTYQRALDLTPVPPRRLIP